MAKSLVNSKISDQVNQLASDNPTPTKAHHHLELTRGSKSPSMPTQDAVPSQSSGSSNSPASIDSSLSTSESEDGVDLTACPNVSFELRDGLAGVRLKTQITPLVGHLWLAGGKNDLNYLLHFKLRRFPLNHPL